MGKPLGLILIIVNLGTASLVGIAVVGNAVAVERDEQVCIHCALHPVIDRRVLVFGAGHQDGRAQRFQPLLHRDGSREVDVLFHRSLRPWNPDRAWIASAMPCIDRNRNPGKWTAPLLEGRLVFCKDVDPALSAIGDVIAPQRAVSRQLEGQVSVPILLGDCHPAEHPAVGNRCLQLGDRIAAHGGVAQPHKQLFTVLIGPNHRACTAGEGVDLAVPVVGRAKKGLFHRQTERNLLGQRLQLVKVAVDVLYCVNPAQLGSINKPAALCIAVNYRSVVLDLYRQPASRPGYVDPALRLEIGLTIEGVDHLPEVFGAADLARRELGGEGCGNARFSGCGALLQCDLPVPDRRSHARPRRSYTGKRDRFAAEGCTVVGRRHPGDHCRSCSFNGSIPPHDDNFLTRTALLEHKAVGSCVKGDINPKAAPHAPLLDLLSIEGQRQARVGSTSNKISSISRRNLPAGT